MNSNHHPIRAVLLGGAASAISAVCFQLLFALTMLWSVRLLPVHPTQQPEDVFLLYLVGPSILLGFLSPEAFSLSSALLAIPLLAAYPIGLGFCGLLGRLVTYQIYYGDAFFDGRDKNINAFTVFSSIGIMLLCALGAYTGFYVTITNRNHYLEMGGLAVLILFPMAMSFQAASGIFFAIGNAYTAKLAKKIRQHLPAQHQK